MRTLIDSIAAEYRRYRKLGDDAVAQVADASLHQVVGEDGNSIAIVMRHIGGNLRSRFTDFLTSDGEKSWRNRESEFEEPDGDRATLLAEWDAGWNVLFATLDTLTDADLAADVKIRGVALKVHEALHRSLAHTSYHVGQIVLLARVHVGKSWKSLSIPRGQSAAYNAAPVLEKPPR